MSDTTPNEPNWPAPNAPAAASSSADGAVGGSDLTPAKAPTIAVVALVFSVLALLICWVPVLGFLAALVALIVSIVGFVKARRVGAGKGLATGGLILSIISFIVSVVILIGLIVVGVQAASVITDATTAAQRAATTPLAPGEEITTAEYDQLAPSMTYQQVVAIVGSPGTELINRSVFGSSLKVYAFRDGSGKTALIVFADDALRSKQYADVSAS